MRKLTTILMIVSYLFPITLLAAITNIIYHLFTNITLYHWKILITIAIIQIISYFTAKILDYL